MFCRETKVTSLKIQILCPQILIFQFFERPYVLWELLAPKKQHGWSCYWCTFTSWQRSGEVNYVLHFFSRDIGIKIIPLLFVKKTLSNTLCILMFVWFSRFTRIVRSPCTCLECECDLQLWSTVGSQSQLNTYPVDHGLELILITVWNVYWKNNNVLEVEIN